MCQLDVKVFLKLYREGWNLLPLLIDLARGNRQCAAIVKDYRVCATVRPLRGSNLACQDHAHLSRFFCNHWRIYKLYIYKVYSQLFFNVTNIQRLVPESFRRWQCHCQKKKKQL